MTTYTPTDLGNGGADGWEFKILRSATGAFKKPDVLRQVLEEEGRAGWVMIEKFDSQRVRLKRPATAKSGDSSLGFDPYRTTFGISETRMALTIMVCALGFVGIVIGIIVIATH